MPTLEEYLAAGSAGAQAFGLDVRSIEPLSHSENVVCTVTTSDGERLVLRIHRPGYNTVAELESEVVYVRSLGASGVPVPTALATPHGAHYVPVDVGGVPHQLGMVGWVEGEPLGAPLAGSKRDLADEYGGIGRLAAAIRIHAANWTPPAGFVRRRWDADGLVGPAPLWGRFWEVDGLTTTQRSLFSEARETLRQQLGELSTGPDRFGLIHADLHLGNVMSDGGGLTVIDFDDCGYGWFAHELAVALHPMLGEKGFDDARSALVDGYRAVHPLSEEEEALIDTFLAMRCLMIVGWLDQRRELPYYEHFADLAAGYEIEVERLLG